jgi:hypothetical protein
LLISIQAKFLILSGNIFNMLQKILAITLVFVCCGAGYNAPAQTCNQPGALISVRNSYRSHLEYIVFTFVDPYNHKGDLHKTNNGPFVQVPSGISLKINGHHFYKITFPGTIVQCETKNYYVVPQKKLVDIKPIQYTGATTTYIIGLAEGAKIVSHTAYNYQGFHMVKIRIE